MMELRVKGVQTIPTYEVAGMMDRAHSKVIRMLEGDKSHVGIIPTLTEAHLGVSDYFIKGTYKDASGKQNKYYECTKMGCELLANKMTGEKGILFTAKYVAKFNAMEKAIELPSTDGIRQVVSDELDRRVPQLIGCKDVQVKAIVKTIKGNLGIKTKKQNYADYETVVAWLMAKYSVYKLEDIPFSDQLYIDINTFITKLQRANCGQKKLF